MRKKSGRLSTILLTLFLLVGLSVMLYPAFSNWWNSKTQSKAIASYQQAAEDLSDEENAAIIERAHVYNSEIAKLQYPFVDYAQVPDYDDILDITGTGIMGYISIPQIRVELPIYHGTSEGVLNVAVGHLQGSTLPVGGENTHCVISAHRGLPSAELFSDLDQLVEGDEFTITVLKEVYTYEVEEIFIVLPDQTEKLNIIPGGDYVTLTTCTPYGVNSHRLLVRAHRVATVENGEKAVSKISADAVQLDSLSVVPFIAAPLFLLLLAWWIFGGRRKKFPHGDPGSVFAENKNENKQNDDKT
ncbi:MAG: class C sortase [Ruminococcus sp.]|nr:class C sortase [Ruminococcus sp.]